MTALWELSICVFHCFATLFKEIKIVVDYDVAFQSHTQIVLLKEKIYFILTIIQLILMTCGPP